MEYKEFKKIIIWIDMETRRLMRADKIPFANKKGVVIFIPKEDKRMLIPGFSLLTINKDLVEIAFKNIDKYHGKWHFSNLIKEIYWKELHERLELAKSIMVKKRRRRISVDITKY